MHRYKLWLVLVCSMLAAAAVAASAGGAPNTIYFQLNAQSFGNEFGGASPERAVQTAGTTWAWSAGMRRHYAYTGTTTWAGCGLFNPNHIYAVPGIDPADPFTLGYFNYCPIGGWEIRNFLDSAEFTLGIPSLSQIDFQAHIQHELGHDTTPFHASGSDCVMVSSMSTGTRKRWFCTEDIENIAGNGHGHARAETFYATSSAASWPQVGATGWTVPQFGAQFFYGFGLGALTRGNSGSTTERTFVVSTSSSLHGMQRCDNNAVCVDIPGLTALESLHRPTVTYDFRRGRYWLFWLIKAGDQVQYATSTNGSDFSYHGSVGDPAIRSRVPVSATYDNISDKVLVAYSNFAGNMGTNSFGAATFDSALTSISASTPGGAWAMSTLLPNRQTDMPPVIACENSVVTYRCQLARQSPTSDRRIVTWRLGLDVAAQVVGLTDDIDTGGLTNYPIALTSNGPTMSGNFALVVSGAAETNSMWYLEKKYASSSWSSWNIIQSIPSTYLGPQIGIKEGTNNYELIYAKFP